MKHVRGIGATIVSGQRQYWGYNSIGARVRMDERLMEPAIEFAITVTGVKVISGIPGDI